MHFMSYYTYILESLSTGRLYIGQTNNLKDRIDRHNSNRNLSTRNKGPWRLIYSARFNTRAEAVQLEKQLKTWKNPTRIRSWIERQG